MDKKQLYELIIVPTLKELDLYSPAAANLLIGTACTESRLKYIKQVGGGPALGIFQMEPATHDDLWKNFLLYKPELRAKIKKLSVAQESTEMMWNLKYAVAMCRVHYLRAPESLPAADDQKGMARYWKKYYNTILGKGKVEDFLQKSTIEV